MQLSDLSTLGHYVRPVDTSQHSKVVRKWWEDRFDAFPHVSTTRRANMARGIQASTKAPICASLLGT